MRECSRRGIWRVVALLLAVLLLVESMPLNALAAPLRRYSTAGNNSYIPLVSSDEDDDEYDEGDRDGDVIDDRYLDALGLSALQGGRPASMSNATMNNAWLRSAMMTTLATPVNAYRSGAWTGPTEGGVLSASNNYIRLDSANALLKQPSDFAIGKYGERTFNLEFGVRPEEIPAADRNNIGIEILLPAGFTAQSVPNPNGAPFRLQATADGQVLIARPNAAVAGVSGQITLQQNAIQLISDLAATEGKYRFQIRVFKNYGTPQQTLLTTTSETVETASLLLQTSNQNPTYTITNDSDSYSWMPGEISWPGFGRKAESTTSGRTGANEDAKLLLGSGNFGNANLVTHQRKGFEVSVHKTEGYIGPGAQFEFKLPGEGDLFEKRGVMFYWFESDDGIRLPVRVVGNYNEQIANTTGNWSDGIFRFDANMLYTRYSGTDYSKVDNQTANVSNVDLFRKAGTFHFMYFPIVRYNKLYTGDWTATAHTASVGSEFKAPDNEDFGDKVTTGTPLKFNYIQGTEAVTLDTLTMLDAGLAGQFHGNNINSLPQYDSVHPEWADSRLLEAQARFVDNTNGFKIQDDLSVTYDFGEELAPVHFSNLGTAKEDGLSYRFYIKDAATGAIRLKTILAEGLAGSYTPRTVSYEGVNYAENPASIVDGAGVTSYDFTEADSATNKEYIARVEVFKDIYGYDTRGAYQTRTVAGVTDAVWFNYKLRAYHHRMSNGQDIPDNFPAYVKRSISSKQLLENGGQPLTKDVEIKTRHLVDRLDVVALNNLGLFEVNKHDEVNAILRYGVTKYAETMDYNVDPSGNAYVYGDPNYNPPVVEIEGDTVQITDHVEKANQRLLGFWDENDVYHDFRADGFDPDQAPYLRDGVSMYSETKLTVMSNANDNGDFTGQVYDLNAIFAHYGVHYAKRLVLAQEKLNDWKISGLFETRWTNLFAQHLAPGHLNYDSVIGTNGAADLPKDLRALGRLYCEYSDYKSERVNGGAPHDSNQPGGIPGVHGTARPAYFTSAKFVLGEAAKGITIKDLDYYVNPYTTVTSSWKQDDLIHASTPTEYDRTKLKVNTFGMGADQNRPDVEGKREVELTRVELDNSALLPSYNPHNKAQLAYREIEYDFTGTDPRLLSLTNTISFGRLVDRRYSIPFTLEYTLSNGQNKTITDMARYAYSPNEQGRMHYVIPDVDIENGVYITSLKLRLPSDLNWGNNSQKYGKDPVENSKRVLPDIGLGMYNVAIPKQYPGTTDKVGSISDNDSDASYDKLTVKAKLSFEDIYGTATSFTATGASNRIAGQQIIVDRLTVNHGYNSTNTYQGSTLQANLTTYYTANQATSPLVKAKDVQTRPTFYYKIDKNFTYVDGSLTTTSGRVHPANPAAILPQPITSGVITHFVPAGTGAGESGSDDYGILAISYENIPESELATAQVALNSIGGTQLYGGYYATSFKLQAKYNADPINVRPVIGVWMDTDFDADRDGTQGGNPRGITVETSNGNNQLVNDGPVGPDFFNQGTAKISAATGKAEMLYVDTTTIHKINQQAILGLLAYAQSTIPSNESPTSVSSRDIRSNDNIFNTKVYITGDNAQNTSRWELYIPVMKKGERYSYTSGGVTNQTTPNEYDLDYYGIDTSTLAGLNYSVAYTTDPNPAAGGYATAKAANYSASIPANKADITMIRVKIDDVDPSKKSFVNVKYKLHEPKSMVGSMKNQNVVFGNFNMGSSTSPYFGTSGQSSLPLTYTLADMQIGGFVWDETDRNSTYNAGTDSLVQNVRFRVYDPATNAQVQLNTAPNGDLLVNSRANGTYEVLVPHDGNWIIEADTSALGADKKLVLQNKNNRPAVDSAYDRELNRVATTLVVNPVQGIYSKENVNAGLYTAPKITIPDLEIPVNGGSAPITAVVTNPIAPGVTFSIPSGQPTDIVTLQNNGTTTGSATPQKTGTVTVTAEADDGYGGKVRTTAKVKVYTDIEYNANNGSGSIAPNGDKLYPSVDNTGADAHTDEGTAKAVTGSGSDTGFTRPGYLFTGWNTEADGSGQSYAPGATVKTGARTAPLKLYAQWQQLTPAAEAFKIKKNVSGDWGTLPNTETSPLLPSTFKFVMTSISANAPMPAGATSTANPSNVTGAVSSVVFSMGSSEFSSTVSSKEITTGLISFTLPGTYSYVVQEQGDSVANYSYDSTQYKLTYTVTAGVGGTLSAQRSIENLATAAPSGQIVFDNAYNLPSYQVSFDPQGGDVTPATQTVKYGHYAGEPTTPAGKSSPAGDKTGYDFRGWVYEVPDPVTGALTEVPFAFASTAVKQNYALKAKWELKKLTVVVTDAPNADAPHTNEEIFRKNDVPYGGTTAEPTRPENKTGYHFDRWLDHANNPYDFTRPVTKNETVHASYAPNAYKVRYNANAADASGSMTDSDHVYDTAKNLTGNAFTRPGYVFDGWNTEANGSGTNYTDAQSVLNLTTQNNAVVNLYAKWTPVTPATKQIKIQKTLTGDRGAIATGETAPLVAETFGFTLQAKPGTSATANPMPAGTAAGSQSQSYSIPTSDLTSGSASLNTANISFTLPGVYEYEVKETQGSQTGYSYDAKVYTIRYTVTQTGANLDVTTEVQDGAAAVFTAVPSGDATAAFTNDYQLPQYQVVFDADGGSVTPPTQSGIKRGGTPTAPTAASPSTSPAGDKNGYLFVGWFEEDPSGNLASTPYDFTQPLTGNKKLKAKWLLNEYKVKVKDAPDADGSHANEVIHSDDHVPYNGQIPSQTAPNNKTGYHFNGWVDESDNSPYSFGTPVRRDTTVVATYAPNHYKVHYDPNGSNVSGTVTDSNHVYDVAKNLNQNNFTRPGFTFGGWNTAADGSGQNYTDQQSVTNLTSTDNATVTLYAVWRPVNSAVEAISVKKELNGDVGTLANGETSPLVPDTFRFELKAISTTAFGLSGALPMPAAAAGQQTYVLSKGSASLNLVQGVTDTQAGQSNGTVASGPFSFTMPGEYVYEVRELAGTASGYSYDSKVYRIKYTVVQNLTQLTVTKELSVNGGAYAAFNGTLDFSNSYRRPQYTVSFDPDGGNVTPGTQTVKHGNKASDPPTTTGHSSPAGEKTGYRFGGWIDTATGTPYNFNTPVTGDKTLKAKWDLNQYRVIVKEPNDANPGKQNFEYLNDPGVNHGSTVTAPPTPDNKTGHHFNGWVDQNGNPYTFGTPVTQDTTVTATYAPNQYTVQYDKNAADASGTVADSTHTYDVAKNLNTNNYTRPGYEFAGWATTPTGTVSYPDRQSVINLTTQNNGIVKLYAIWTQATPATEAFGIQKTLSGDVGPLPNGENAPIVADTFRFRLTAKQTNAPGLTLLPMPAGTAAGAQTADYTLTSAGLSYGAFGTAATGTVASGLLTFTLPGDYYYELTELAGSAAGYSYGGASKVYTLHYKVTQSGTTLSLAKEVKEGSGSYAPLTGALAFDNSYALPSYTVSFNAQGGDVTPSTQTVKYGHFATRPQTQAGKSSPAGDFAGHIFGHWSKQGDPATTAYDFEHTPVTGNITLDANWTTNSYTITVTDGPDANPPHQNEVISNTTVPYNTPSTEPNRPNNKTGYHFDHWEKNNDPSHTPYIFGTPVTGNETIHAVYAPNSYTVRYNKDAADASGTVADSQHTYDVARNLNNNAFTRPGYEFAGWTRTQGSTTVDFADQASVVNLSATDGAVVDLYAVWTAATPIAANVTIRKTLTGDITTTPGGLASPITPETFRFELKAISTTAPGVTVLPMPAAAAGAQTAVLTLSSNDLTSGLGSVSSGNLTFTMPGEYVYELKELSGSSTGFTYDQTVYSLKYTVTQSGTTLSVAAEKKSGSGAYQPFNGTADFTNDYQLPRYRVSYDSNLGSATPPTESNIKYGHFATQPGNAAGTGSPAGDRVGFHFKHWIDTQTGQIFNFGDPITRDVNLQAVWERNGYTVTVNDGPDATTPNQNISTQRVPHGDPATEPNRPNNKPGYHFDGWKTSSNTPYTFGTPVTEDQTIHAGYAPNHYTVKYEANGSNVSGTVADSQHTYDLAAPLTQNSYTRPGYQFSGWAERPDGSGTQYTDQQSVINLTQVDGDTVHLYAVWTPVTPYQLDLGVQKILSGEIGLALGTGETSPLNTENFRFKLIAVNTTAAGVSALPMPNGTVGAQETELGINGAGNANFGPMSFVYEGDYIYRLTEIAGTATGYSYDPAVYELTVRVSQAGATMNGNVTVKKDGGTATTLSGDLDFTNDYRLPRFQVSFNPNGGSNTPSTQLVRYGDPALAPSNAAGTSSPAGNKTGQHFLHWAKPDGTPYNFGDPVTADTLLTAIWDTNRYTITVIDAPDANPGHQSRIITTDNQIPHGATPVEPQHPDNKTDHVFDHWEKPDGTPYRFDEPMTGDLTVHAVYRRKQYNVQFEQNGSFVTGNMSNQHFNGGETKPLSSNLYSRPGFVFGGWGRTPDAATPAFGDGQNVSNLTQTDGETVKLYAIWTPVTPALVSVPTVRKQITGDTPHNAGQFSFELSAVSTTAAAAQAAIPMPATAQGNTDRITVDGAGRGNFGDISFRFPGTYVYRIAELPEGRKGFRFDPDEVTLTYIVTQNGANLNVVTSAQKNGNPVSDANFVNRFTTPDYTITFDGNGSWVTVPSQSVREGGRGTDPRKNMLRTESKFIGWYLNGQPYDFSTPVYDDITLVAMYEYKSSGDNSGGSGGGGGGNGGGGSSSGGRGNVKPNTNTSPNPTNPTTPTNTGIADNVIPPVELSEPVPQQRAEEKKTPTGEAISPDSRKKGTSVTGSTERSKRGKLPKTGEAPIANPLPKLAALTLAAYALLTEDKRRRKKAK